MTSLQQYLKNLDEWFIKHAIHAPVGDMTNRWKRYNDDPRTVVVLYGFMWVPWVNWREL